MLQKLLYLALAGACGTLARYWLGGLIGRNVSTNFPLGTAIINIAGCLAFGLLWAIIESRLSISGQLRTIIFVGFFGAFTTFSSFAFETAQLLDESQWLWASANIVLQNVLGLVGMIGGLAIGKYI
ncbi:MAG TPA: fluoride efflux transporter CrcB [Phycisphaerales bacterium]|nr:MAG: chromosome condensation protein CrcB [Planctomycetes bacterium GWC2_45_44]HBG77988.1 fluoride efflux transporter CrcB [Phycisphaerales bacterium]HBR19887.1 fluoride efflux transporter CrcB [Phycisphaerales bacterium]